MAPNKFISRPKHAREMHNTPAIPLERVFESLLRNAASATSAARRGNCLSSFGISGDIGGCQSTRRLLAGGGVTQTSPLARGMSSSSSSSFFTTLCVPLLRSEDEENAGCESGARYSGFFVVALLRRNFRTPRALRERAAPRGGVRSAV